jgi:hypothetical protein
MGSPALLIKTQALSSNLTTLPSGRCHFFAVRTTTACRTSPRRTLFAALTETEVASGPKFRCFWTTTTMRSPVCPLEVPFYAVMTLPYQLLRAASIVIR